MEILSINAEEKLSRIAETIEKDTHSWSNWHCLFIDVTGLEQDEQQECLVWIKSIADTYFNNAHGRIFFCHGHGIYLMCKNAGTQVLKQAGSQITDLIYAESGFYPAFTVYELDKNGFELAADILSKPSGFGSSSQSPRNDKASGFLNSLPGRFGTKPAIRQNIRIMLVDDEPVTRWMVRNTLKGQCEFAAAATAANAYTMLRSFAPDLVFLDIGLPDQNGHQVLEWIKSNNEDIHVVILSGNDDLDTISSTIEEGASGFIAKPFLRERLMYYIENLL